ncbi:hypothetical protein SEA_HAIL_71 [Mycobacterium phage Hail]|uniref:Uncharacterized protein n=13 Tax=Caudoviricetes TaxID=2731619 RepID=A0A8T8JGK9_9CAUD|nr:hypothetical protein Giles_71 [Mycobacterium phage Giles]AHY84262.1 hypothetical protein PBI_HH92_77 [Mycobacterium phage HH92]AKQ07852.1 hypothetical protein SEA_KINBOTE_76 [Mycobacterium phage Kinbote]ALA06721.1 hypothetical protein SEA_OBUpride_77 [Mycobacterium phage OBUpride]ATN90404.1 hypothetical protein SEA_LILHAZELNUT_78 [Mycobacterium phage LilHazelnut]AYB69418.1 hypothetical protein SEA_GANCHO_77 [Mycobacterium phage Gancho]QDH48818.1 hypothetical protein SEA_DEEPSOIL15_78 [Myco
MMPDSLRDTLIRAYTMDMRRNYGNVVVAEVLHRRVDYHALTKPGQSFNTRGAVMIDAAAALAPLANAVRRGIGMLVMIYATDELLWIPTRADLSVGDYWTVEMVPWVEYLRASAVSDDEVIRKAHDEA